MILLSVWYGWTTQELARDTLLHGTAYAQEASEGVNDVMVAIMDGLQALLQVIYVILWPLLYIAGIALDNTLVYGEFINLDSVLWRIRTITKNLANFALGWFVIYEILKYLFTGTDSNINNIYKVLRNALIAGIGIQASWFVLAAIIDISTILIVWVGWLPLTLMDTMEIGDKPILWVHSYMNFSSDASTATSNNYNAITYYTRGDNAFPPCRTTQWYVVGSIYTGTINEDIYLGQSGQEKKYCALGTDRMVQTTDIKYSSDEVAASVRILTRYQDLHEREDLQTADQDFVDRIKDENNENLSWNLAYHSERVHGIINIIPERTTLKELDNSITVYDISDSGIAFNREEEFTNNQDDRGIGTFLSDIMDGSTNYVWPLVTFYITILEFSQLHTTSVWQGEDVESMAFFFEFVLKSAIGLMLVVPLLMLAVLLIMRVGILWLIIAFSPGLALLVAFGKSKLLENISSKFTIGNILGLIFAPVLPIFVLGLSLIFLQTITAIFHDPDSVSSWENFGIDMRYDQEAQMTCASIRGSMEFCYDSATDDTGNSIYANFFAWMLVNIFAIGLVWTLVSLSFKSNSFTEWVTDKISGLAANAAGSIPLVPLPGVGMTSANAVSEFSGIGRGGDGRLYRNIDRYLNKKTSDQVSQLLGDDDKDNKKAVAERDRQYWNENSAEKTKVEDYINTVYQAPTDSKDKVRDAYKKLDISAVSETGQNILLSGFPDVYKDVKTSLEWDQASENDINEMLELLNSPTGKAYQNNNSIDVLNKDFTVTDSNNSSKVYTIKKQDGSFVKEFKENASNPNNQNPVQNPNTNWNNNWNSNWNNNANNNNNTNWNTNNNANDNENSE